MGPLSHVYVSTQITGNKSSLLVLGSILPDICWGSKTQFSKNEIHYAANGFYDFILAKHPDMVDVGIGAKLHVAADYYSDDRKEGFGYLKAPELSNQVADLLELKTKGVNIPLKFGLKINSNSWLGKLKNTNEAIALVLAHNFVESGVELNLFDSQLNLLKLYRQILKTLDVSKVITLLANYLKTSPAQVKYELESYLEMINYGNISVSALTERTVKPFFKVIFGVEPNPVKTTEILLKAKQITKPFYLSWLNNAARQIGTEIKLESKARN